MVNQAKIVPDKQEVKTPKRDYIFAIGRRKESVARIRLYHNSVTWDGIAVSKGDIVVNKKKAMEYFGEGGVKVYGEPLRLTNIEKKFAITVKVAGGGKMGQLDSTALGIARALDKLDRGKLRLILKKKGFLTRDPRVRQRRKVGMGGKARRKKQSPKR
jgi:small subunit ribosomal protein S9